jgi:photosystem II stability/assembly factor-like uncharacterized protein
VVCWLMLGCWLGVWAEPGWHQVEFSYPVSAVAVESDSSAWAAGTVGSYLYGFLHWDGVNWVLADTFRNQLVYDICFAGTQAWAVGEQFNFPDGVVYRWDGQLWQQQPDPFDRSLQAVAFADSLTGFAGGAAPVTQHPVMKYTNGTWRLDSALTTRRIILGLAATWIGKAYAVGDSGAIFRCDTGVWTQISSPTTHTLRRVAMESNTEGWAVGNAGTILRCFKDMWTQVPSPTSRNLFGLAIAGTSCEAWAVGDSGTILHCVRDSWLLEQFVPNPSDLPLYTVSFNSGTHGWAFGYRTFGTNVALHYFDPTEIKESETSVSHKRTGATIVRSVLLIPPASSKGCQASSVLLDISGRKVMELKSGTNDIRNLIPGVYFIREPSTIKGKIANVRKTIIVR